VLSAMRKNVGQDQEESDTILSNPYNHIETSNLCANPHVTDNLG
jgi:hypothetical protein